eukprot:TRINITY_DN992_c0_g1_i1.p3 TRINITY_DN992_c0_g1~~TRINITY_DN992_c0_g1_i1.p3  ORF type:complete len:107 (-),score=1.68 TRINITY_DN992_c0_g1_i1:387-707(-)
MLVGISLKRNGYNLELSRLKGTKSQIVKLVDFFRMDDVCIPMQNQIVAYFPIKNVFPLLSYYRRKTVFVYFVNLFLGNMVGIILLLQYVRIVIFLLLTQLLSVLFG